MPLIISCLSQKGGVGKSTLARLIARTYAVAGWSVKIADFNRTQLTSVKWVALRQGHEDLPQVSAEPYHQPSRLRRETVDLVVVDGRPDSDQSSLDIARVSDLVVLPCGPSLDDLEPQRLFAEELLRHGVDRARLVFVLNRTLESVIANAEARGFLQAAARVLETDLPNRVSYQRAQNHGRALSEVGPQFGTLEERADLAGAEIVAIVNSLTETRA